MNEQTCRVSTCDRPTDAFVCIPCGSALERVFAETPWLVDELHVVIAKQARYGDGMGGKSIGKSQPLPYDVRASDALNNYAALLTSWVKMFHEENPTWLLPKGDPVSLSRWLIGRITEIRHHEAGGECVSELCAAFATGHYAVDRPAERRYAGPCSCGKDLYHKPGAVEVTCRECDMTYDVGELYAWMQSQVMGRLVTATEGATLLSRFALETKQGTVSKWHERGLVVSHGSNAKGRPMFLFDDLLTLAMKRGEKQPA